VVAGEDQLLAEPPKVRVAPRAVDRDPPLEHGARYARAPGDDAD